MKNITPTDAANGLDHRLCEFSVPDLAASSEISSDNQNCTINSLLMMAIIIFLQSRGQSLSDFMCR